MGNVSLNELGISFVKICLQNYWGTIYFFGIFTACLLGIYMFKKQEATFFVPYTAFLFLTIYNPVLVKTFYSKLGSDVIYYRFFWLLPVSIVLAYFCVEVISSSKSRVSKCIISVALCFMIILTGTPIKTIKEAVTMPPNLYKVPDPLLEMCQLIHDDSPIPNPKVVAETSLHMYLRQYDPSIKLTVDRDILLHYAGSTTVGSNPDSPVYQEQTALLAVALYGNLENTDAFVSAVKNTETNYLMLSTNAATNDYLLQLGFANMGEYGGYTLYRTVL